MFLLSNYYLSSKSFSLCNSDKTAQLQHLCFCSAPTPPPESKADQDSNIWEAIINIKATTCYQAAQTGAAAIAPQSDPHLVVLVEQITTLQDEITTLQQCINQPREKSSHSDDKEGNNDDNEDEESEEEDECCPGLKGKPCVHYALTLKHLTYVTNNVADRQDSLERELQGLTTLVNFLNERITQRSSSCHSI
ncbi:hypothetical protein DSO57_1010693 [Entomophthora muscae]|uniref:Uncharacterized protein n=1 Tax=Entomophthora muscae TaxID=34485 RepID=A0ACC2SJF2_9FUNG|nr:hypothetical protein DSO57_1010693 [Entomophthora muscae]